MYICICIYIYIYICIYICIYVYIYHAVSNWNYWMNDIHKCMQFCWIWRCYHDSSATCGFQPHVCVSSRPGLWEQLAGHSFCHDDLPGKKKTAPVQDFPSCWSQNVNLQTVVLDMLDFQNSIIPRFIPKTMIFCIYFLQISHLFKQKSPAVIT
jgi:hypothetical protein